MSELSSCYFCSTALDAPVRRYPLTPSNVDVDTGKTIALCPSCRRKLGKILGTVAGEVDATTGVGETEDEKKADDSTPVDDDPEQPAAEEASVQSTESAPDSPEVEESTPESEASDDSAVDLGLEDDSQDLADEDVDDEASSGGVEPVGTDDGRADADDEGSADDGRDPLANSTEGEAKSDMTEWETPDESGQRADAPDREESSAPAEPTSDNPDGQVGRTGGAGSAATDDAGGTASDGTDSAPAVLTTPSAKKVIRLLQNREFPVEREEFEIVAQNAYDIPATDCQDVVDALVEEGYVGQDGTQLVRTE